MTDPLPSPASPDSAQTSFRNGLRLILRSKATAAALLIVLTYVAVSCLAPWLSPYGPNETDSASALFSPSGSHLFGTDNLGRDVFSRVLHGGRQSLIVASISTIAAVALGGLIGAALGYAGGWIDEIGSRVLDAFLSLPSILLLLIVVASFGAGTFVTCCAIVAYYTPAVARVARGAVQDIATRDFVTVARARGESSLSILFREIGPNLRDVLVVEFALRFSWALLLVSSMSFLGFGASPPTADWGLMISNGRSLMNIAWWMMLFPAAALSILVVAVNVAADGLSKAFGIERTSEVTS